MASFRMKIIAQHCDADVVLRLVPPLLPYDPDVGLLLALRTVELSVGLNRVIMDNVGDTSTKA